MSIQLNSFAAIVLLSGAITAQAVDMTASHFQFQIGVDAWYLDLPATSRTTTKTAINNLSLANSSTVWSYKSTSPWIKVNGDYRLSSNVFLKYKFRAQQSVGLKLDDLHIDWEVSPKSGVRAGVVDYKMSLCRTYEFDSPWVRENDPFCVSRKTNMATWSAPGVQAYLNFNNDDYQIQAIAGVYRPLAFNYSPTEFSNVIVDSDQGQTVAVNNRLGWSVSGTDLLSGADIRLSWLGGKQETNKEYFDGYRHQTNGFWYLSAGFYPVEKLQLRGYLIRNKTYQRTFDIAPSFTPAIDTNMLTTSRVVEGIYTLNSANTFGAALSRYHADWDVLGLKGYEYFSNPEFDRFRQKSLSLTWRHNFDHRAHMSLQWTKSENNELLALRRTQAAGQGVGVQIGYAY